MNSMPSINPIQPSASPMSSLTDHSGFVPENTLIGTIQELHHIRAEVQRGIAVLYDAECKLADAENRAEKTLQLAFMNAQGTVADRTAISRLQAADDRLQADLAKAEHNRIKAKLKALELAQMSLQTQSRLMETELKTLR